MTMPRPSFVTSSGPSPVRGFIAAIAHLFPRREAPWGLMGTGHVPPEARTTRG